MAQEIHLSRWKENKEGLIRQIENEWRIQMINLWTDDYRGANVC